MSFTSKAAVLITGLPRTGTSALAGCVQALGVPVGGHFQAPDARNAKGYWEDLRWLDIARSAAGQWWGAPLDEGYAEFQDWAARARAYCRDRHNAPVWAVKDSLTAGTAWELLCGYFDKFLVTHRGRAAHDRAREAFYPMARLSLALQNEPMRAQQQRMLNHLGDRARIIDFDDACDNPRLVADRIAAFLKIPCTETARSWYDSSLRRFSRS